MCMYVIYNILKNYSIKFDDKLDKLFLVKDSYTRPYHYLYINVTKIISLVYLYVVCSKNFTNIFCKSKRHKIALSRSLNLIQLLYIFILHLCSLRNKNQLFVIYFWLLKYYFKFQYKTLLYLFDIQYWLLSKIVQDIVLNRRFYER